MEENNKKRSLNEADPHSPSKNKRQREICSYKERCFRKNPHHFKEYDHPHLDILSDLNDEEIKLNIPDSYLEKSVVMEQLKILKQIKAPAGESWKNFQQCTSSASTSTEASFKTLSTFQTKLDYNAPYNLFFTTILDSPETKQQSTSVTFTDLLCPSLGKLKCSLQVNFMIDIMWLMEQYSKTDNNKKPLTILYGDDFPDMQEYIDKFLPNVKYHLVKMKDPYGTHHSKVGIYAYEDGSIRVVVSTANLYYEDWNLYCQSLWVSPKCPLMPGDKLDTDGSGPTNFKASLTEYLRDYKLPLLNEWIERVKRADFSEVKVFFVASMPGKHPARSSGCHLQRVGDLLSRHCTASESELDAGSSKKEILSWPVIAQSSSLGNFGENAGAWLRTALLRSLASHKSLQLPSNSPAKLQLIYPSEQNVLDSYKGPQGGGCLPYSQASHSKQKWLEDYLHQWKANKTSRTRAMPHIKSYCRVSPCNSKLAYFLLTSANISKAAWGTLTRGDGSSYVRSYEVGVLFLPSFFGENHFTIDAEKDADKVTKGDLKIFPFIYDLPLTPYASTDTAWAQ